ncbi:MAG: PAS domain-containing protein [Rhodobacteraceae bacterium]|nr:PAS domain-containing protein [Paracoccaceae bacterium]
MAHGTGRPRAAVIALAGYRRGAGLTALDEVEAYWSRLRTAHGALPTRAQLDPRGFSSALSNCFIAEAIAPRHLRLRLAGQHLEDLMGMDMRGMPLSALIRPEERPQLEEIVARLLSERAQGARLRLLAPQGVGRPALFAGLLLLPLGTEDDGCAKVLGALATIGSAGRTPRRFRILDTGRDRAAPDRAAPPALRLIEGGAAGADPARTDPVALL